jgi:hypothetical protein
MDYLLRISALAVTMLLSACVTMPSGPSVTSLPGSSKSFDQFRADDNDCRQYATNAIGGTSPSQAQVDSAVLSGATGAAVGAAAGAAMDGSHGAGVGAGIGLLFGALAGSEASAASGYSVQQRYDSAYLQCMYAKGHQVPMAAPARSAAPRYRSYPPAAGAHYPPPPPGYEAAQVPPPPPPGPPVTVATRYMFTREAARAKRGLLPTAPIAAVGQPARLDTIRSGPTRRIRGAVTIGAR